MKIKGKKIILCILCLFMFLCGIGIGAFLEHPSTRAQRLFVENNIYLYDTQEKIDQWFRDFEGNFVDASIDMNLSKEEQKELLEKFKNDIPIAIVGKIVILHNNGTGGYQLFENGCGNPIAELGVYRPGREFRRVDSRVLGDTMMPHAIIFFNYDEEGAYVRGSYMVMNKDSTINRIYIDSDGTGQFDQMIVSDDNDAPIRYRMKGMTWTKEDKEVCAPPPNP